LHAQALPTAHLSTITAARIVPDNDKSIQSECYFSRGNIGVKFSDNSASFMPVPSIHGGGSKTKTQVQ
jgi:hypothetical protein